MPLKFHDWFNKWRALKVSPFVILIIFLTFLNHISDVLMLWSDVLTLLDSPWFLSIFSLSMSISWWALSSSIWVFSWAIWYFPAAPWKRTQEWTHTVTADISQIFMKGANSWKLSIWLDQNIVIQTLTLGTSSLLYLNSFQFLSQLVHFTSILVSFSIRPRQNLLDLIKFLLDVFIFWLSIFQLCSELVNFTLRFLNLNMSNLVGERH